MLCHIAIALTAGIPWRDIGDMSVDEIMFAAQIHQEQLKEYAQMQAWIAYNNAALTGIAVNDPKKFPKQLEDAFPSLFEKKGQQQQDWWVLKQHMEDFAKAKNKN